METHEPETGLGVVKLIVEDGEPEVLEPFVQDIDLGEQQPETGSECTWEQKEEELAKR